MRGNPSKEQYGNQKFILGVVVSYLPWEASEAVSRKTVVSQEPLDIWDGKGTTII